MSDTASWYYKDHLPELARKKEEKERKRMEVLEMQEIGDVHSLSPEEQTELSKLQLKYNEWTYDSSACNRSIEVDISEQDMLQYSMIAHDRDITLNHLINEVLHDTIQRDLLQHSR